MLAGDLPDGHAFGVGVHVRGEAEDADGHGRATAVLVRLVGPGGDVEAEAAVEVDRAALRLQLVRLNVVVVEPSLTQRVLLRRVDDVKIEDGLGVRRNRAAKTLILRRRIRSRVDLRGLSCCEQAARVPIGRFARGKAVCGGIRPALPDEVMAPRAHLEIVARVVDLLRIRALHQEAVVRFLTRLEREFRDLVGVVVVGRTVVQLKPFRGGRGRET